MQFFNLHLWKGKYQDFLRMIKNPDTKILIFTPNPEILLWATEDREFYSILQKADYLTPDGAGLYIGSLIQEGYSYFLACFRYIFSRKDIELQYGERIKGSDLTRDLIEKREKHIPLHILIIDRRVTKVITSFDQRKKDIQKQTKTLLESQYPGCIVHHIYDDEMSPDGIAHFIQLQNIRYVFSCLGMKSQEKILVDIFSYLPEKQKVVGIGVGSSIDYLIGLQVRAPLIFQKIGLEWLYRLIRDPRNRYKRIWRAVVEFPRKVKYSRE